MAADTLPPILLVGAGKMGAAMLAGWRAEGLSPSVAVDPATAGRAGEGVAFVGDAAALPPDFAPAAVVFAIKPQGAAAVVPLYRRFAGRALFVSIMAGPTLASLSAALGGDAAIVRAMPNTPAAIRRAITVAVALPAVSVAQRDLAGRLLRAIGDLEWVEDEALLDAVTAVSGSGPAYVFLLAELLEAEAVANGVSPALGRILARRTVAGAGALLDAADEDAAALRRAVTSPGGTTEAALSYLTAPDAWPRALRKAVRAAAERSRALRTDMTQGAAQSPDPAAGER